MKPAPTHCHALDPPRAHLWRVTDNGTQACSRCGCPPPEDDGERPTDEQIQEAMDQIFEIVERRRSSLGEDAN